MTNLTESFERIIAGELIDLEKVLARAPKVILLDADKELAGGEAAAAFRSLVQQMPDLAVTGRIDRSEGAIVLWLDFTGLPWLPNELIRTVLRISERIIEILGGLDQLLSQQLGSGDLDSATAPPSSFHPNALILRAGYDDPPVHATIFTDTFIAHTPGRNQISGDWQGQSRMAEHLARIRKLSSNTMSVTPLTHFALANDGFGVVFSRANASRGSKKLDQYVCGVWRFDQGKLAEHWELVSDPQTWDEFWNESD